MSPPRAKRQIMAAEEAYSLLALGLEETVDLTGEVVALDHFLEDEAWAKRILRPRQRILAKIIDAAANHAPLEEGLSKYPFTKKNTPMGFDGEKLLITMPHCITKDDKGVFWYDEPADWKYLTGRENKYARVFVNLDDTSTDPRTIVLIIGRGGGKTTLAAGISAHQAYRILSQENPFALFNLDGMKPMRIQNVATSSDQANEFFDAFVTMTDRVDWFTGRCAPPKMGKMKFGKHLWAERSSSNSRSARGRDTVVYIHDEIAFAEKTGGARSDRALYAAIRSGVKTRAEGKGLVIILSSPAEADGVLFELFSQAERGMLENSIVVQMAAWEIMPGQTKENYRAEFRSDEDVAEMEFGAQFFTGAKNLLPNIRDAWAKMHEAYQVLCPEPFRLRPLQLETAQETEEEDKRWKKTQARYDRVIHVDTSEGGDRLVVIVIHVRDGFVVVDLVRVWKREVGYTRELIPFVEQISKRVPVIQVSFDQFASHQAIQDLDEMGIKAIKTPFTQLYNDEIARNIRQVVLEGRLAMPPVDMERYIQADVLVDEDGWDDEEAQWPEISVMSLMREMEMALKKIRGQFISAEAPTAGFVKTDDALDALMAATAQAITLSGGLMHFFTIPRLAPGLTKDDQLPPDIKTHRGADTREVYCPHHKGHVVVAAKDKVAECPTCKQPIQTRM